MREKTWTPDQDRPKTAVTIEIPVDVVEDLRRVAQTKDMTGLHELIRYYVGRALKQDLDQLRADSLKPPTRADSTHLEAVP